MNMEVDVIHTMEDIYEKIVQALSCILEPMPMNQLGMPEYCRYILGVLANTKQMIEELEESYRSMLRSYDTIDEEF